MTISSAGGARLAKAKVVLDKANDAIDINDPMTTTKAYSKAHYDFCQAAREVADDLVAQGMHDIDGGVS